MAEKSMIEEFNEINMRMFNKCDRNIKNNPNGWDCKPNCLGCCWYESKKEKE